MDKANYEFYFDRISNLAIADSVTVPEIEFITSELSDIIENINGYPYTEDEEELKYIAHLETLVAESLEDLICKTEVLGFMAALADEIGPMN